MRRLPVYLVLDTSGSMYGEPIESLKNGLHLLLSTLRQDPQALETAYLSVITFSSGAKQVSPLTDLASFQPPNIEASGSTELGAALKLLAQCIDKEVAKTTSDSKGDWKPLVFLMTDGGPTDDWNKGLAELKKSRIGLLIACAAGPGANTEVLKKITDIVVVLDTADRTTIQAFFKWVSASISTGSQKIESGEKEVVGLNELPPPPPEVNLLV